MRKKVHAILKDSYRYEAHHNSTFTSVIPRKFIYHYGNNPSIKGYSADVAELYLYNAFRRGIILYTRVSGELVYAKENI